MSKSFLICWNIFIEQIEETLKSRNSFEIFDLNITEYYFKQMPWVHFIPIIIASTKIINIVIVISIILNNYAQIYQSLHSFEIFLLIFILRKLNENIVFSLFCNALFILCCLSKSNASCIFFFSNSFRFEFLSRIIPFAKLVLNVSLLLGTMRSVSLSIIQILMELYLGKLKADLTNDYMKIMARDQFQTTANIQNLKSQRL